MYESNKFVSFVRWFRMNGFIKMISHNRNSRSDINIIVISFSQ